VNLEVRRVRAQRLGAPSREWRSRKERRQPLDLENGRIVGSGTPSPITRSGVRRLKGVIYEFTSNEVPRAEHERTRGITSRWGPRD
jgi:hypothetical protein